MSTLRGAGEAAATVDDDSARSSSTIVPIHGSTCRDRSLLRTDELDPPADMVSVYRRLKMIAASGGNTKGARGSEIRTLPKGAEGLDKMGNRGILLLTNGDSIKLNF